MSTQSYSYVSVICEMYRERRKWGLGIVLVRNDAKCWRGMYMRRKTFGLLIAVFVAGGATLPEVFAFDLSGVYLGGNFGRARTSYDTNFIDRQINSAAANVGGTADITDNSIDKMSNAWWVNAGYIFTPYIGVDAAFLHLGDIKYLAAGTMTSLLAAESFSTANEVTSRGPALSLLLRLPLTESFAADMRVGDYYGKATWNSGFTVAPKSLYASASKSTSSLLAGVGASYIIGGHWSIRLDYLRVNQTGDNNSVGKFSVNVGTVGVSYTF